MIAADCQIYLEDDKELGGRFTGSGGGAIICTKPNVLKAFCVWGRRRGLLFPEKNKAEICCPHIGLNRTC